MTPIKAQEAFTRHPAISLRNWKNKQAKHVTFTDEGKDIPNPTGIPPVGGNTPNGLMYLYLVKLKSEPETHELWVRPNSALEIGLRQHVPLNGKTLKIVKTTGPNLKDTRYNATEVK